MLWNVGYRVFQMLLNKMLRNVSKNVNKCWRMLTNVGSCWIEMLDENVTKNVVECSGILRKGCGMLRNVIKNVDECWSI